MTREFKILLAEDNVNDAELISEAFKECRLNYQIQTVSTGEEAMQALHLADQNPDLFLLDLNLPKKSGLEVLREVRADFRLAPIPVIILTNSQSDDDIFQAYGNCCSAYVRKPLGFDELVEAIQAIEDFWFETATLPNTPDVTRSTKFPPKE
jgi:two-component system, chemotaxis family, response regulator Rcp1